MTPKTIIDEFDQSDVDITDEIIECPWFVYDNAGIEHTNYDGETTDDCVIRALSIFDNHNYEKWYNIVTAYDKHAWRDGLPYIKLLRLLRDCNFTRKHINNRPTIAEYAKKTREDSIVITLDHAVAVIGGKIHDQFYSGDEKVILAYTKS